jgi:hypothetical protein
MFLGIFVLAWCLWAVVPITRYLKTFDPENGFDILMGLMLGALIVLSGPIGFVATYKKEN